MSHDLCVCGHSKSDHRGPGLGHLAFCEGIHRGVSRCKCTVYRIDQYVEATPDLPRSAFRIDPADAPEVRAAAVMKRNVLHNFAINDAAECFSTAKEGAHLVDSVSPPDEEAIGSLFRTVVMDLEMPARDRIDGLMLYRSSFLAEWDRLAGSPARPRPGTDYDLKVARVREHLVELAARIALGTPAPMVVDGALDAIMQVLA